MKVTLYLFLFIALNGYADTACDSRSSLSEANLLQGVLLKQKEQVQKILDGETQIELTTGEIFGHDFKLNDSQIYIDRLNSYITEKEGLSPEVQLLAECLNKLGHSKILNEIKELSLHNLKLKIELYKKNLAQNNAIKNGLEDQKTLPKIKANISDDIEKSLAEKKDLELDLLKAQDKISQEKNIEIKELNSYVNGLTRIKIDILNKRIDLNKNLEDKLSYFDTTSQKISKLSSKLEGINVDIKNDFEDIEKIWIQITKQNLFKLINSDFSFDLPVIPELPRGLDTGKDEFKNAIKLRTALVELKNSTITELTDKKTEELKLLNTVLLQVNRLRSNYYKHLDSFYILNRIFSLNGFSLIKNELMASPYRLVSFLYDKYLYVSDKVSRGKAGVTELIVDICKWLGLLVLLYTFKMFIEKAFLTLDRRMQIIVIRYRESSLIKTLTTAWNRLKDNFAPLVWCLIIEEMKNYRFVENISFVLDWVQIILFAQILKSVVVLFLSSVSLVDGRNFMTFKKKSMLTSSRFSLIFTVYYITLSLIEITVGRAYFYSILNFFGILFSLFLVVNTADIWEKEFKEFLEKRFSGAIIQRLYSVIEYFPRKIQTIFTFIAIIILSIFDILIKLTENFEVSKKISANLFKKQIEKVEAEEGADQGISQDYKENFSFKSLATEEEYVEFDKGLDEKIDNEFYEWLEEKSDEHSVLVFGDKGIGKTTYLKQVCKRWEETKEVNAIYSKMPSKTLTKKELHSFLSNLLGLNSEELDLGNIDKILKEKTVIFIDEAQNVFLSKTGGFEAYYELIDIINQSTDKVFWVLSFNKYSWLYLDRAFGRNQFFRNIFELKGWKDDKIKELIMLRHSKSKYKLSYDLLINATRSQDEVDRYSSVEAKFFKLLWELSQGNPRTALYLWLTALSKKNRSTFNVNIPKELELTQMQKLNDNMLFVLAHILKHENLSMREIEMTTNFPKGVVSNSIKLGQERKFLYKDSERRFMIDIASQHGIIKYLRLKNFIYGN